MLLDEMVEVTITNRNSKHYAELGYEIPTHISVKTHKPVFTSGSKIMVNSNDLISNSTVHIHMKCDYCGEIVEMSMNSYYQKRRDDINKDCCGKCAQKKTRETLKKKYGHEHALQNPEFLQKQINTNLNRYGETNPMKVEEFKQNLYHTNLERYGTHNPSSLMEFKEKRKHTMMERYGCEYSMQNPDINNKRIQTCIEKYGFDNPAKSPDIQAKMVKTMYNNGTMPCSFQQRYIHKLYGGELNYPFERFSLDIFNPQDGIVTEYNGSGHKLSVIYGSATEEEFNRKEIIRSSYIKKAGYFLLTIESEKDLLPSDEILLQMYSESLSYFNTTNHTWRTYDIDKGIFIDTEHKDGESYDFGNLRKIHKQTA